MIIPFQACSSMIIAAPSNSGKTTFVYNLLKTKNAFTKPVDKILYCYGIYQPLFDKFKKTFDNIEFHEGLPDDLPKNNKHFLLILDDLQNDVINNYKAQLFFTQGAHHLCMTVIFITHNAFAQGKFSRTISLNATYMILFRNMRDGQQIVNLGKQMYPGKNQILVEAYTDATAVPYNPLIIDMSPHTQDKYRLRSNIFGDMWIYVPKSIKDS